jgi:hypothetical protein
VIVSINSFKSLTSFPLQVACICVQIWLFLTMHWIMKLSWSTHTKINWSIGQQSMLKQTKFVTRPV